MLRREKSCYRSVFPSIHVSAKYLKQWKFTTVFIRLGRMVDSLSFVLMIVDIECIFMVIVFNDPDI